MDSTRLRFGVLGPVAVWRGDTEVRVSSRRHRQLLAVLLLHVNERVTRSAIIDLVWGAEPARSADNLVQKYVGDLRRAFDPAGALLHSTPGGYELRLVPGQLDSEEFAQHLDSARTATAQGDPAEAARQLSHALALWRGPVLDGIDLPPVEVERARLDEQRATAMEDLAEIRLARGEHDAVATDLARLVDRYPLRERLRELQMLALYRQGRQADALQEFDRARRLLADELGVDPGPSLRRLHGRILRADPALELSPTGRQTAPVHQLPADIPDFTGRHHELDAVVGLLSGPVSSAPPVVAIAGGPGIGKSSLAVHAAHLVGGSFPDGQLYLDLAGTSDDPRAPGEVLAEVLRVLGVIGTGIPDSQHERAALYRSLTAGRRMLVVLDDAANAEQVRPLLPAAGGCAAVITSRRVLGELAGARHIDLDLLPPTEAWQLFAGIVGADRVAVEPAQAEAILRACGNLPLAIRIAAAKLAGRPAWSLRVLRERLDDESRRLTELRIGELGVRASFDVSLRGLPAEATDALSMLGLLGPHPLPGWIVGPLLDRPEADDVLDTLVDASLVRLTGTDAIGQPRYRMHDLLRAYSAQLASTMPAELRKAALTRVLAAWLDLAERAVDRMPASLFRPRPGRSPRWPLPPEIASRLVADPLDWFDAERENLLGAVKLAADWELDEFAWELAAIAAPYYDHRSLYEEWQRGHQLALRAAQGNKRGQAVLLSGIGQVHIYRDDYEDAVHAFEQSAGLCQDSGDKLGQALAIAGLGTVARVLERYDEALDRAQQALDIVVAEGNHPVEAALRNSIASSHLALGHRHEAQLWFEQALALARRLDDRHREALVLRGMSRLYDGRERALDCLRQALRTFDELEDDRCGAYTLMDIGRVHVRRGDRARAVPVLRRAQEVFNRHGNHRDEAECWQLLGELHAALGERAQARVHLRQALRLWQALGADDHADTAVRHLGELDAIA